jgi:hypothetical protein
MYNPSENTYVLMNGASVIYYDWKMCKWPQTKTPFYPSPVKSQGTYSAVVLKVAPQTEPETKFLPPGRGE